MPSAVLSDSTVAALERLVDYAGLFPPAKLPMEAAAAEYERCRGGPHAWMLGRFVVPATQIASLESCLSEATPVPAAVLFDGEGEILPSARVRAESCEVALRLPGQEIGASRTAIRAVRKVLRERAPDLAVAIELPRGLSSALLAEAMDALADCGFAAKIRCGGVVADSVPPVDEIADFIRAASHARVPFKATAGLHHPIRHFNDGAGFTMHGFLNVLAAAAAAPTWDTSSLREIVADEDAQDFRLDGSGLHWRGTLLADASALTRIRRGGFLGVGSCSFTEPVDDLIGLGILPAA
ncbi:MAG: hypothetical protein ACREMP_04160 [Candidatus Tyrphobacter sp.]